MENNDAFDELNAENVNRLMLEQFVNDDEVVAHVLGQFMAPLRADVVLDRG